MALMLSILMVASTLVSDAAGLFTVTALTKDGTAAKAYAATEFSSKLEAEDAVMAGSVKTASTRSGYSGTGYATGFTQSDSNSWSMQITLPATQHYSFTIRTASDSYKENYLYINGVQAATIYSKGDGEWHDTVIDGLYLEAGTITISIKEYWGWFDLDYIAVQNGSGIKDSVYEKAASTLVNPNANQKTQNIMDYLKSIYGKHTLSGQSCTLNKNTEAETLYNETGKYPALRLFDLIFCSPASSWQNSDEVTLAMDWDKGGGLTSFQWHWHAPKGGASFYTKDTSFDISKAVTDYDISTKSLSDIKAMYEAGQISEECYLLVRDIDVISGYLDKLQQAGVTVLWRPLHEASGGWFWWGAKGAAPYLWLYKLMFNRQTYYHHLNNLIWVWNGQSAEWYPGDDYCDIVGTDIYASAHNYSVQSDQFMNTANFANGNKMTALSENGVMMDPDLMVRDNTYWLWFGVWYGDYLINSSGVLNDTYTESAMVKKVYNSEAVITRDELPDFNSGATTPTPTTAPTLTPSLTPTTAPTVTPTTAPTAVPTIAPTAIPTAAPTVVPTTVPTATPVPSGSYTVEVTNTSAAQTSTNTISSDMTIKYIEGNDIDLSKLTIRYYYTKEGTSEEEFLCDSAAVQQNKAPWYTSYVSDVSGSTKAMSTPAANADSYIEIGFTTDDAFTAGATLLVNTRLHKKDWSVYDQLNDYSYNNAANITLYYDGALIYGTEPGQKE